MTYKKSSGQVGISQLLDGLPDQFSSRDFASANDLGMWDVYSRLTKLERAGLIVPAGYRAGGGRGSPRLWQQTKAAPDPIAAVADPLDRTQSTRPSPGKAITSTDRIDRRRQRRLHRWLNRLPDQFTHWEAEAAFRLSHPKAYYRIHQLHQAGLIARVGYNWHRTDTEDL